MEPVMAQPNDLSRPLAGLNQDSTLIAVVELAQASWLVAGILPGVHRHLLKKIAVDQDLLLLVLRRWKDEAEKARRPIKRIAVALEAGRDGFWLAHWLRPRGIEAYVIHPSSVLSTANIEVQRRTAWTPSCSSGHFSPGCVVNQIIAAWRQSPHSKRRTPNGRVGSGKVWSVSAYASSTG
jgi:hypothetical protein